jgi:hypothetical protein
MSRHGYIVYAQYQKSGVAASKPNRRTDRYMRHQLLREQIKTSGILRFLEEGEWHYFVL